MECPRCHSKSFTSVYRDETKCLACGHTDYRVPQNILDEYGKRLGEKGVATKYIRSSAKKYYN
jgi:Zn ribbon nucleic-acid-binding protein